MDSELGNRPIAPVQPMAAPGMPQEQPQERPLLGNLQFHLANGDTEGLADEHMLLNDMKQVGYQPTGVSADGLTISLMGQNGPYQVKTADVLQKMGWQVKGMTPKNVDYDHVDTGLRMGIESPGLRNDDLAKEAFLKARLSRSGIHDPQIVGGGSDWYVFNPESSQYIALTNKEGMDISDIGEIGARAPGFLGAVAGSALGAYGGPAALATMPAGGAAGGWLGNRLADTMAENINPEVLQARNERDPTDVYKEYATEGVGDALGGLGAFGIGKAVPSLIAKGILSRAAKTAGTVAEPIGEAVGDLGKFASKGAARDTLAALTDPTGITMVGDLAQIPAELVKGGARGIGWMGEHPAFNEFLPDAAARAREISRRLLTRTGDAPKVPWGHTIANGLRPGTVAAPQASAMGAEEILGNAGRMMGGSGGVTSKVGRALDTASTLGDTVRKPIYGAYSAAGKGVQGLGRAMQYGGKAAQAGADIAAPLEVPGLTQYGSEEIMSRLRRRQKALQAQGWDRNIVPDDPHTLVSTP